MRWLWFFLFLPCSVFGQSSAVNTRDTVATTTWRAFGKDAQFTQKIKWLSIVTAGTSTTDTLWLAYGNDTTTTKNSIGIGKLIPIVPGVSGEYYNEPYINKFWLKKSGSGAVYYTVVFD